MPPKSAAPYTMASGVLRLKPSLRRVAQTAGDCSLWRDVLEWWEIGKVYFIWRKKTEKYAIQASHLVSELVTIRLPNKVAIALSCRSASFMLRDGLSHAPSVRWASVQSY